MSQVEQLVAVGRMAAMIQIDKDEVGREYSEQASKNRYGYASSLGSPGSDQAQSLGSILREGDLVLDDCCGNGALFRALQERIGPGGTIIALDLSLPMLLRAREAAEGLACGVYLVLGDGERLPIKSGCFDAAICSLGLHRMNPLRGLEEMYRVLGAGRYMILTLPHGHSEDYRAMEHIPPSLIPRGYVPLGWEHGFPESVYAREQEAWRRFKEWCAANQPWLYEAIRDGWAYGYDDLESGFKDLEEGRITSQEFDARVEEFASRIGKEMPIVWVWFPSFRGFSRLLEEFRALEGAILIQASSTRNQHDLREGSPFEIYHRIHFEGEHLAILGKPPWGQDEGTSGRTKPRDLEGKEANSRRSSRG